MQIVAIGVVGAILSITVKKQSADFGLMLSIAASILIFFVILPSLATVVNMLFKLSEQIDINTSYIALILKVVGIAYIAEFGSNVCADAGEGAIASKIEMGGKALIMLVSAPILLSLIDIILGMLPWF